MNKKILTMSILAANLLNASGFILNEQSSDGIALANANVATNFGADASYYNPANMVFLDDKLSIENSFSYFQLNKVGFKNSANNENFKSKKSKAFAPTFHAVSPSYGDWRFGLSLVVPAGMVMRWDHQTARNTAAKFELKVVELNPTVAYKINEQFSVGFGLRTTYARGSVENYNNQIPKITHGRELKGDSIDYGYNLALAYRPVENLSFGATYRSKIKMSLKGHTKVNIKSALPQLNLNYDGAINIDAPVPATLNLAVAYTWRDTTFMFAYQRTYWSAWKEMDFDYADVSAAQLRNPIFKKGYEDAHPRNWRDTNSYRIGIAHNATDKLRLMGGFMIDKKTSLDDKTGFDVPDTNAYVYSAGLNYKINSDLEIATAFLYQDRQARKVNSTDSTVGANGEFQRAGAYIVNLGVKYKF